jgi:hypothetical protein
VKLEAGSIIEVEGRQYEIVPTTDGEFVLGDPITPMWVIHERNGLRPVPPGLFEEMFGHLPTDPEG